MCNGWAVGVSMYWWQWQIAILSPCVFFALLSFWSENHTPYHIDRGHSFDWKKNFSRSDEAFSQTDVKTNVYKRMLSSRLPWQLDLFSSQTKTFVSEITGRIRAWKQADSCSEDLPLAIQIGQCLLLVGFNGNPGRKRVMGMGRCTISACCFFNPVVRVSAALFGPLRGRNRCCLWFWQLVFGVWLRDATSNLPSSPNPLSNRSVLHDHDAYMGESIHTSKTVVFFTIQRSPRISTSYKFAAPRYRLPCRLYRWGSNLTFQRHWKIAQSCRNHKD